MTVCMPYFKPINGFVFNSTAGSGSDLRLNNDTTFWYAVLRFLYSFEIMTAGCFTLIVFLMYCASYLSVALLKVPWICLLCVIVVFPDHTR